MKPNWTQLIKWSSKLMQQGRSLLLIWLLLVVQISAAQSFRHTATLAPVPEDNFYRILLPPGITSYLNQQLSDIRVYDGKNQEVPYLLQQEKPVQVKKLFKPYEIIKATRQESKSTTLILRNSARSKINNISLIIKNTNVRKPASLSGSNDAQTWYGIEDHYLLHSLYSPSGTQEVKMLNFPLSDYEYYKLDIVDSISAPLNILSAGFYDTYQEYGKYSVVPSLSFKQFDSSTVKKTYLKFTSPVPVLLDKITLEIATPTLFRREATFMEPQTYKGKRGRTYTIEEPIGQFLLTSNQENTLPLSGVLLKEFYLVISNKDNPPLQVKSVNGYQLNRYLVASLQKNKAYQLRFGDEKATTPAYDLSYFKEKIPANITVLTPQQIKINAAKTVARAGGGIFTNRNIIWGAILVVMAFLGYMSYQMLNEAGKR